MSFIKKILNFLLKLFYRDHIFIRYKPLKNITSSEVARCMNLVPMSTVDNPLEEDVRIRVRRTEYEELPLNARKHFKVCYD